MIEETRNFLRVFDEAPMAYDERLWALVYALDRLAIAFYETKDPGFIEGKDPPKQDLHSAAVRAIAIKAFPDFGYYPTIRPTAQPDEAPTIGDAIDDLVDIRAEMLEVAWRCENNSQADAEWYFRFSYGIHWWRHLHDLRGYVLDRLLTP